MPVSFASHSGTKNSGSYTIRDAEALCGAMADLINQGDRVVVDWSDATEVDVSAVQILLAARKSALRLGKSFTMKHPASGALLDVLLRGGFLGPQDRPGRSAAADFWLTGVSTP